MITTDTDNNSLSWKADAAFRQAAQKVIQKAKQTSTPIVIWEDGHVKEVPATEMELKLKINGLSYCYKPL